jgi:hypothetical protein
VRTLFTAVLFAVAVGCGGNPPPAAGPGPEAESPLSYDEWKRIADPEEKFNRHTLQRLPKEARERAVREQRSLK